MTEDLIPQPNPFDESAKAIQEILKLGTSLLSATEKGGGYFASVFGGLPANYVGLLGDRILHRRWMQHQKLQAEKIQVLRDWNVQDPVDPPSSLAEIEKLIEQ